jgi:hypothetical protein
MMRGSMPPELVAPAVVWLASEECDVTGQEFAVWSGRIARVAIGTSHGLIDRDLTAEKIAEQWPSIDTLQNLYEPLNAIDEVTHWQAEVSREA